MSGVFRKIDSVESENSPKNSIAQLGIIPNEGLLTTGKPVDEAVEKRLVEGDGIARTKLLTAITAYTFALVDMCFTVLYFDSLPGTVRLAFSAPDAYFLPDFYPPAHT